MLEFANPAFRLGKPGLALGRGGAGASILDGIALYGDSFADGSSGGGGRDKYNSLGPTLTRYLSGVNLPSTLVNHGQPGATSSQCLPTWLGRTARYKWNLWWAGRNNINDTAQVLADAQSVIADLKEGEKLLLMSVHNVNGDFVGGAEPSGSTNYADMETINSGYADLADNETVFYIDTRTEFIFAGVIGDTNDDAAVAADEPPPSLTADGLHANALGCDIQARLIFWQCFELWLAEQTQPPANLVVNGDFTTDVSGWDSFNGAAPVWDNGALSVTAASGTVWKLVGQQVLNSGANGHRYMLAYDLTDQAFANWQVRMQAFTGGGGIFTAVSGFGNPINYGVSIGFETAAINVARRKGHKVTIIVDADQDQIAFVFAANNDAGTAFKLDNVKIYQVG